jgi:small subunit ribosomal protein S20
MAHHKSSLKRIRQTRTRKLYNRLNKKGVKNAVREVRDSKTYDEAWEKFKIATKVIDRVSTRGVLHKNYAANKKSSLAKFVNSLAPVKA